MCTSRLRCAMYFCLFHSFFFTDASTTEIYTLSLHDALPISFKCTPERFAELIELEGVRPAPYVGRYHWVALEQLDSLPEDRKSTRLNSSHEWISYAVFCLKKKKNTKKITTQDSSQRHGCMCV